MGQTDSGKYPPQRYRQPRKKARWSALLRMVETRYRASLESHVNRDRASEVICAYRIQSSTDRRPASAVMPSKNTSTGMYRNLRGLELLKPGRCCRRSVEIEQRAGRCVRVRAAARVLKLELGGDSDIGATPRRKESPDIRHLCIVRRLPRTTQPIRELSAHRASTISVMKIPLSLF